MHYIRIKQEYIDFMKEKESRIPNQQYGNNKYKPFYILSSLNGDDVLYVTQLTSPKSRHYYMKNNYDFKKIFHPTTGRLLGATNLNYMFPVLPEYIEHLSFSDLKEILQDDKKVSTLAIEKKVLGKLDLKKAFEDLYRIRYEQVDSNIAQRCLDFKMLESYMLEYKLQEQFNRQDIQVERSKDYSTFFIHVDNNIYEYSETILEDIFSFLNDIHENIENEIVSDLDITSSISL